MADGRDQSGGFSYRLALPWTNIFRCFQIALDPAGTIDEARETNNTVSRACPTVSSTRLH